VEVVFTAKAAFGYARTVAFTERSRSLVYAGPAGGNAPIILMIMKSIFKTGLLCGRKRYGVERQIIAAENKEKKV